MKFLLMLIVIFSQPAFAGDGHKHGHEHASDLKAQASPAGASILQLGSTWQSQRGESIKLTTLGGKARLVVMLYTKCETACPLIVEDLKQIAAEIDAKRTSRVEVSIFSLDSFRETPESLMSFSVKRKLPSHWGLFTSNADAVAELAAALGVRYKRLQNGEFIHSNVIYFLNSDGEIVAQKEGLKTPRTEFIKQIKKNL